MQWTDGKAYPFIKITTKDPNPAVLQTRRADDSKAVFFGPFPNIGDVRRILKSVRRIFPYQSVRNHPKRVCLYYHLGLCPCLPVFDSEKTRRIYRRNIRYLIDFLAGKKRSVVGKLTREMKQVANREDFEEASRIKKQLDTIAVITSPMYAPTDYIQNPNLLVDEGELDVLALMHILGERGIAVDRLSRIECYDISNIQGKEATGALVVAIDGLIDKSHYRRFRIRFKHTPDDTAMHSEVLTRRLRHADWPLPDLIVIDGGALQVNAATKVVNEYKLSIPVIGLAKRLEEIYIPQLHPRGVASVTKLTLSRDHRALKLLQRLRDEAHRFAIAYHRMLRRKTLLHLT